MPDKSAASLEGPERWRTFMSGYVWDLSGIDQQQCISYCYGHQIHWIQFRLSMERPGDVIPVTAKVDENGMVDIEGDGVHLVRWNHRPALVAEALHRFGGMAVWKPRWHILAVPAEAFWGGAATVFSLATSEGPRECRAVRSADSGRPQAEQEAKRTEVRNIDRPLRIADRYAAGIGRAADDMGRSPRMRWYASPDGNPTS